MRTGLLLAIFALVVTARPMVADEPEIYAAATAAGLSAPRLAQTSSTILLLWGHFAPGVPAGYEILQDGNVIARTGAFSWTATNLRPAQAYRFSVRAVDASGSSLAQSDEMAVTTKASGEVVDVKRKGAKGDGKTNDTAAIQSAIDACPRGGIVFFPAGDYAVAHLELKSNLTLELSAGATLRFLGREAASYSQQTVTLPGPDGEVTLECGALISGRHADNVTIMGAGKIAANGATWWPKAKEFRPKVLELVQGRNLLVQGITIEDPPFWNVHPVYLDHAIFNDVTLLKRSTAPGVNGDGLDPDSCFDILIVGCAFGNQDDSIAIKCGKVLDAQPKRQRPCENLVIRDCRFDGTLAPGSHPLGIGLGSETCGGVRHVRVRDCAFVNTASLINIKSNRDRRGAIVEDVRVEDCTYTNSVFRDEPWNRAPIVLDMFYYSRPDDPAAREVATSATPIFRDLHFSHLSIDNPRGRAVYLSGLAERPIQDVTFTRVQARSLAGFSAVNVDGIMLDHVSISAETGSNYEWNNVAGRKIIPEP